MNFRRVFNEQGSALLVALLLVILLGAMGTAAILSSTQTAIVSNNHLESEAASRVAEIGVGDAMLFVRRLDDVLDTNGDGEINSKDEAAYKSDIPFGDGEYDFSIKGEYADEHEFYFKIVPDPSDATWARAQVALVEDDTALEVTEPCPSCSPPDEGGTMFGGSNVTQADYVDGSSETLFMKTSVNPYVHTYQLQVRLETNRWAEFVIYVMIDEEFPEDGSVDEALVVGSLVSDSSNLAAEGGDPVVLPTDAEYLFDINDMVSGLESGAIGYDGDVFEIKASGKFGNQRRNVRYVVRRDTFLKYARFSDEDIPYGEGAILTGQVYARRQLQLPDSCCVTFRRRVSVAGIQDDGSRYETIGDAITNRSSGVYENCTGEGDAFSPEDGPCDASPKFPAREVVLPAADDMEPYKEVARDHGLYYSGSCTVDFDDWTFFVETEEGKELLSVPLVDGTPVDELSAFQGTLPFNGVVYCIGNASVKGYLQGRGMTVFSDAKVYVTDSITTGQTMAGSPVNVGLVGNEIRIHQGTPRVTQVQAALFAWGTSWYADGNYETHLPIEGTDYNGDGVIGGFCKITDILTGLISFLPLGPLCVEASAVFNSLGIQEADLFDVDLSGFVEDGRNTAGYRETELSSHECSNVTDLTDPLGAALERNDVWLLLIWGPIITAQGGSAGPWSSANDRGATGICDAEATRVYAYDQDITAFEPPYFPIPLNGVEALSIVDEPNPMPLVPPTPQPTAVVSP